MYMYMITGYDKDQINSFAQITKIMPPICQCNMILVIWSIIT